MVIFKFNVLVAMCCFCSWLGLCRFFSIFLFDYFSLLDLDIFFYRCRRLFLVFYLGLCLFCMSLVVWIFFLYAVVYQAEFSRSISYILVVGGGEGGVEG